jgi:hypothetical protein
MRVRGSLTSFPSINRGQASKDQNQDREVRETIICSLLFCLDTHQTATNLLLTHLGLRLNRWAQRENVPQQKVDIQCFCHRYLAISAQFYSSPQLPVLITLHPKTLKLTP